MNCPACGVDNIEGTDECSGCGASLMQEFSTAEYHLGDQKRSLEDPMKSIGFRKTIVAKKSTSVWDVIQDMKNNSIGCALIVEKGELVGIFTERDVLKKLAQPDLDLKDLEIENFMTPSPEVLSEEDSVAYAINKMAMGTFRHVPLKKMDGSFAMISVKDILHYFF